MNEYGLIIFHRIRLRIKHTEYGNLKVLDGAGGGIGTNIAGFDKEDVIEVG